MRVVIAFLLFVLGLALLFAACPPTRPPDNDPETRRVAADLADDLEKPDPVTGVPKKDRSPEWRRAWENARKAGGRPVNKETQP
jgi:hypothetical protein